MYACRYVCTYVQCPYVLYMRMYESGRKWGKTQRSTCQPPPPLPPRNPPWRETSIAPDPEIRNRDRKPLLSFFPMSVRRLGGGGGVCTYKRTRRATSRSSSSSADPWNRCDPVARAEKGRGNKVSSASVSALDGQGREGRSCSYGENHSHERGDGEGESRSGWILTFFFVSFFLGGGGSRLFCFNFFFFVFLFFFVFFCF